MNVFNTINSRDPINTQALYLIRLHDRMRAVKPSVANEGEEKESDLAKLT